MGYPLVSIKDLRGQVGEVYSVRTFYEEDDGPSDADIRSF